MKPTDGMARETECPPVDYVRYGFAVVTKWGAPKAIRPEPGATPVRVDLPDIGMVQLSKAHKLRNVFVEIHRNRDRVIAAIRDKDEGFAAASAEVERLRLAVKESPTPQLRFDLKQAKMLMREARAAAYASQKPLIVAARRAYEAAMKAAYQAAVDDGLHWGTAGFVRETHEMAVKAVMRDRKQGKPAELKFHRWDGSGSIRIALQRQQDKPRRSPELLSSGHGPWANVFRFEKTPSATASELGVINCWFGLGKKGGFSLPFVAHRALPDDADIAFVTITRTMVGPRARLDLSITWKKPPPPIKTGASAAVHVGWRSHGDGSIRVGLVRSSDEELTIDNNVFDVVRRIDSHTAEVVVPKSWRSRADKVMELQSQREVNLNAIRSELVKWDKDHGGHPDLEHVALWRSPSRFARVALDWRNDAPADSERIVALLEAWRVQDKHLWSWFSNQHRKLAAQRLDAYRRVAAWIVASFGTVVADSFSVVRSTDNQGTEKDLARMEIARRNAALASPGVLRLCVSTACRSNGVDLQKPAKDALLHMHSCGSVLTDRAHSRVVPCSCGEHVDQDVLAATNLLATFSG